MFFSSLEDDILFIVVTLKEIKTEVFLHKQLLTLGISDDDYTYVHYKWMFMGFDSEPHHILQNKKLAACESVLK